MCRRKKRPLLPIEMSSDTNVMVDWPAVDGPKLGYAWWLLVVIFTAFMMIMIIKGLAMQFRRPGFCEWPPSTRYFLQDYPQQAAKSDLIKFVL